MSLDATGWGMMAGAVIALMYVVVSFLRYRTFSVIDSVIIGALAPVIFEGGRIVYVAGRN